MCSSDLWRKRPAILPGPPPTPHAGRTDLARAIYDSMTGRCKRAFSFDDIEVINDGLRNLASSLEQAGYEEGGWS